MKILKTTIVTALLFLLMNPIFAQIDFEKYEAIPLPNRTPMLDSSITTNGVMIFDAANETLNSNNKAPQNTSLKNIPPSDFVRAMEETMSESRQFNNLVPADQIGILTDYPIRTVVKLYITLLNPLTNQTSNVSCSGILVGDNEVLTAGHCVDAGGSDPSYASAITVVPAYNMGSSPFGSAQMTQWLSFTQWTDNGNYDYDIAMVKLNQSIGNTIGWLGFGYNMNNAAFTSPSNTFHSFGYPAQNDAGQTVFEGGERMYYMNGFLDYFESSNSMCHYNMGFHGQSGSGLYYNDNGNRITYGVLSHGSNQVPNTCHTRIDDWMFGHFVDFYDYPPVSVEENQHQDLVTISPNPSETGLFTLQFTDNNSKQLNVMNATGAQVKSIETFEQETIEIDLSRVSPGVYYCSIIQNGETIRLKLMKI